MRKTLLVLAIGLFAAPPVAEACGNEVEWTVNDYVRVVARAEKQIEAGQFREAKRTLGRMRFPNASLQERADDVKAVITLRTTQDAKLLEAAAGRFKTRSEKSKDVRFKAWLAEALLATGKKEDARVILVALHESDLMPDAYAFLALAKLSAGQQRFDLWKQCRTRAKNKDMCELPAEVKTKS